MMVIEFNGETYHFDLEEATTEQLVKIKKTYDLNLSGLAQGMQRGDIDAMRCIFWLMQIQNGKDLLRLETVTLDKPVKFASSLMVSLIREQQELVEKAEALIAAESADPKD